MNEEPVASMSPGELPAASYGASAPVGDSPLVPAVKTSRFGCAIRCVGYGALLLLILGHYLPPLEITREQARQTMCKINLKRISLALSQYHETYSAYPPAYTVDASGKPLHSWRTLLLPFFDEHGLHHEKERKLHGLIDFSKPWDDPANLQAGKVAPFVYQCPSYPSKADASTTYLAVFNEKLPADSNQPSKDFVAFGEGNSILLIEVTREHAVPWMSPVDADAATVMTWLQEKRQPHGVALHVVKVDGSVQFVGSGLDPAKLRALMPAKRAD